MPFVGLLRRPYTIKMCLLYTCFWTLLVWEVRCRIEDLIAEHADTALRLQDKTTSILAIYDNGCVLVLQTAMSDRAGGMPGSHNR